MALLKTKFLEVPYSIIIFIIENVNTFFTLILNQAALFLARCQSGSLKNFNMIFREIIKNFMQGLSKMST